MTTNWMAIEDGTFAIWAAKTSDLRGYARIVFDAGERHEVHRLVTVEEDGSAPRAFEDRRFPETSSSPFDLPYDDVPEGRWLGTSARLAWWEDGKLREGEVAWVGALLERLRPGADEDFARQWMSWVPPVAVWGTGDFVHITLRTDAWFPRTMALSPDDTAFELPRPAHDNLAVAEAHAPRLNAFLATLRADADRWELLDPEGVGKLYADQVTADGITLS